MARNTLKVPFYVNGNKEKGKSHETRDINLALDSIKAHIRP